MTQQASVYDLGEVAVARSTAGIVSLNSGAAKTVVDTPTAERKAAPAFRPRGPMGSRSSDVGFNTAPTLSLILPGSGPIIRGQYAVGLFFLASLGFLGTLGWAVMGTLDRLTATFQILGLPRATGVWILGGIYGAVACLHVGALLTSRGSRPDPLGGSEPHPLVSGLASVLIPGWGQVLNGNLKRGAMFVGVLWITGASWLLVSPQVHELMEMFRLYLPPGWVVFSSPVVRWVVPAVVWALSVYDAAASAAIRRQR